MPLWSEDFALDTETDVWDGVRRTVLVQACPVSAQSLKDVRVWHGEDAWRQFMRLFEETSGNKVKCHCYNLGGFESVSIIRDALEGYVFSKEKNLKKGEWNMVADKQTVYKIAVKNQNGCVLEFTDDMRRVGGASMKKTASGVRAEHPEWWANVGDEVKEETDYHEGWLLESDADYEKSLHYSILDAFSQAMITRYLMEKGYDRKLTSPALGLEESLCLRYRGKPAVDCSVQERLFNTKDFQRWYPPLDRRMQDIAERSLLGGFVWGETGHWHGQFSHADYTSSYPYEYVYGDLFYGRVSVVTPENRGFTATLKNDKVFKWVLVSFDFEYIEGMMPAISGRDVVWENKYMTGNANLKMKSGRIERMLFTATYLEELKHHYRLTNIEYHEIWYAKRRTGDFAPAITEFFTAKNKLKAEGKDDTIGYSLFKNFMNGGVHGKTITKTHRERRIWNMEERRFEYEEEVNDPKYCFLIGFSAMQNARERLLRDCRKVLDAGHRVMMCDTDSMVVDCDAETLKAVLGAEKLVSGKSMEESLGRFEIENDKKGLKRAGLLGKVEVSETFDEFKCWGLKRYCEIRNIEGYGRLYRKSAFAGMHDEAQEMLMDVPVDFDYEFEWTQKGKRTGDYCAEILDTTKHMSAKNVWYDGEKQGARGYDEKTMKEICNKAYDVMKELGQI